MRGWLLGLAGFLAVGPVVFGYQEPANPPLPDFDKRRDFLRPEPAPKAARFAAAEGLKKRVKGVKVEFDHVTGSPKWVASHQQLLSGERGAPLNDPHGAVKDFVKEHRDLFGHGPEALDQAKVKRSFGKELRTTVWEQEWDGVPVFEGVFIANVTERGELVSVSSQFVPALQAAADKGMPNWRVAKQNAKISARRAVVESGKSVGVELREEELEDAPGKSFKSPKLKRDARAELRWVSMGEDAMRLCWEVHVAGDPGGELYRLFVDCETAEVLVRHCRTFYLEDATYRVFTTASPAPMSPGLRTPGTNQAPVVSRSRVTLPALSTNASPVGWISDGGNETRGNNVEAHLDRDANDQPDLPRPQGSPYRVFDFPLDLGQSPETYGDAAAAQLFYWCNWMHDRLYELGFTEAAGNFQKDNFGRGGAENDAMIADAQDGSGRNNARYFWAPDGFPGHIEMFLFDGPEPDRDGSLDAEVVLHEYTHGLTDRLVGGGVGIYQWVTYGLAEGWSDFYALAMLNDPAKDVDGVYTEGGYVTHQLIGLQENYYFGIRRYPYSTDMSKSPLTFKDIDPAQISRYPNVPRSPIHIFNPARASEPHRVGEIWCLTLWEARANMIRKHGPTAGNELILQLVTDGLKLSPPNPTFLQSRDAILLADRVRTGGANQLELWAAFAKRGMGLEASEPPSFTTEGVRESFDRPDPLLVTPFASIVFSGPAGGPFTPACRSLTISNSSAEPVTWTAGGGDPYVSLSASSATLAPGAATSISVCPSSVLSGLPLGAHGVALWFSNQVSGVIVRRDVQVRVLEVAAMPFREDFEAPALGGYWQVSGVGPARAALSTSLGAQGGVQHLLLQGAATGFLARNEVSLALDLAGYTNVVLRFWAKEFQDEPDGPPTAPFYEGADFDGVAISVDGYTWYEVAGLRRLREDYSEVTVDLDDAIRRHPGLNYTSAFRIRFNQTDNGIIPNDGIALDSIRIDGIAPRRFTVSLPEGLKESDGTVRGRAEIKLPVGVSSDVSVELSSSDPIVAAVPNSVLLRAGTDSAAFDLTLPNDDLLDGVRRTTIRATAPGYLAGQAVLSVADDETATLTLEVPASLPEGSGTLSGVAEVRLDRTAAEDLVIELKSSDARVLQVPMAALVPAGSNAAPFDIEVMDDGEIDGPQSATITAKLSDTSTASAKVDVPDNESTNLFLSLPRLVSEAPATLPSAGVVRLSGSLPTNLTIALSSSSPETLRPSPAVTILAGRVSSAFTLSSFDDNILSNAHSVSITAEASQFSSASSVVNVLDNDSAPAPYGPSPEPFASVTRDDVQLAWSLGMPELVANGGFENGSFSGWQVASSAGSDVIVQNGSQNPPGPEGATAPFAGRFSVLFQPSSPGIRMMYQDVTIPAHFEAVALNWTDRIRNHAGTFSDEHVFRVEIQAPDGGLLAVPFSTEAGSPALNEWHERSFSLNAYRGTTIRIAFLQQDSLGFLNVHLDNVRVMLSSPGPTSSEVYFGATPNLDARHLLGTTTATSFELPALGLDSIYYWRIVARRGESRAAGPVWQFRTQGIGVLDHFQWSSFGLTQSLNQPFPVQISAKDGSGNTVPSFLRTVQLSAFQRQPPEPVRVLTFSGYSGREYRAMLAGISTHFTNYIETTITAGEALEPNLPGQDVFIVPEQAAAPVGALPALATMWAPVLSNFVYNGGLVIVCSYLRDEHEILNQSGLMQLTRVLPFGSGTVRIATNHALVQGVPPSFQAPNLSSYDSLNGLSVAEVVQTNASVVLTRTFGSGQAIMIGYDFTENRTPFDRIAANAVRLAERERVLPIEVAPPSTGYFEAGVWSGNVAVAGVGSNIVVVAEDAEGHRGATPPFTVIAPSDLSVEVVDLADPVFVGSNVVYRVTVQHTAPGVAEDVEVSAALPAGMSFVSATSSEGTCTVSNETIRCDLGAMSGNDTASVLIELAANTAGRPVLTTEVSSSSPETYLENNAASANTRVLFPSVFVSDAAAAEGNTAPSIATFNVEVRPPIRQRVSLNYATSNFVAQAETDYERRSGTLVFEPGETNKSISVPILPDTIYEAAEFFFVRLSAISNAIPGRVVGSATIFEDDPAPVLSIEDAAAREGALGSTTQALFTVALSTNAAIAVTAKFRTTNETALAPLDYQAASGIVTFQPGVTRATIAVNVLGDAASETDETFLVTLSSASGATLGRGQARGLIRDDDGGKIQRFAWHPIASPQSYGVPFEVTVTAQDSVGNTATEFTAPAKLAGWSASRQIALPPGTNSWEFPMGTYFHDQRLQAIYLASEVGEAARITALALRVTTVPGQALEGWTIRMKHTGKAAFADAVWEQDWATAFQGTVLITSNGWTTFQFNEPFEYNGVENLLVDFSFNNISFSSDGQCATTPTPDHRSLYFRTDSGFGNPATWAGSEPPAALARRVPGALFMAEKAVAILPQTTGLFTNGVWRGALTVHDVVENMSVRADDGQNHFGSANVFTVAATNDVAVVAFDSPDPVRVGDSLAYTYVVTNTGPVSASGVVISNILPPSVSLVSAHSSQGSCQFGGKIVRCELGSLSPVSTASVTLFVVPRQTGFVTNHVALYRGETEIFLGNNTAQTVTRVNPLAILVADTSIAESTGMPTNLVFNVRLSSTNSEPVQVEYFTSNGTATNNLDYLGCEGLITFDPGVTNLAITVSIIGDNSDEPSETFFLNLTNAVNSMIAQSRVTGTIADDDPPPVITVADLSVQEANAGNTTMAFAVQLSSPSEYLISFGLATSNGTATAGQDYFPASLTFLMPPRLTNRFFNVAVFGDRSIEADETFYLNFSRPVNAVLGSTRAVGTIINDDGLPGVLEKFVWSSVPSPAFINEPFATTITARDSFGALVTNYSGSVILGGRVGKPNIAIGAPNSQLPFPFASGRHDARMQVIYLSRELEGARPIMGLALEVLIPPGQTLNDFTIRLKHTSATNYTSFAVWETNDWTMLYRANQTIEAAGWLTFPFTNHFQYDGTNNLLLDLSFNNTFFSLDGTGRFHVTNQTRTIVGFSDSAAGDPLNWNGYVPGPQIISGTPVIQFICGFIVPVMPTTSESFANGLWSGNITVLQPATNMAIVADDGLGHVGVTELFDAEFSSDLDGDGLLDEWERLYFGSLNANPHADPDGDGLSNLAEQLSGTHPLDAANVLAINAIRAEPTGVQISFRSVTGKRYRLERTYNLSMPNWTTALDNLSGPSGILRVTDSGPVNSGTFYRIRLLP